MAAVLLVSNGPPIGVIPPATKARPSGSAQEAMLSLAPNGRSAHLVQADSRGRRTQLSLWIP